MISRHGATSLRLASNAHAAFALSSLALLAGCGSGSSPSAPTPTYPVSGTVSGLRSGTTLVLTDNGSDTLTVTANGTFTFAQQIAFGQSYAIAIQTQPKNETCLVYGGNGTNADQTAPAIIVRCEVPDTILVSFGSSSTDGNSPTGALLQASDGNFYGVAASGGPTQHQLCGVNLGCGTLFRVTPSGQYVTLYSFGLVTGDGATPEGGLIQASDGNLYGTTAGGGTSSSSAGTFYRTTLAGDVTILYSFGLTATDGVVPTGELLQASDGNFYGTTTAGGTSTASNGCGGIGCGTVYKITPQGVETVLYSFGANATDGTSPNGGLIQGSDGALYGTTYLGGANKVGTVFRITTSGAYSQLYAFGASSTDGTNPLAPPVQGPDGALYGTTYLGGVLNGSTAQPFGTVYRLTLAGVESIIHNFAYDAQDGAGPESRLVVGSDGNLYGATIVGGATNNGTLFRLSTSGVETLLYSFNGSPDGSGPQASPIFGTDGNLYGVTNVGGTYACLIASQGCGTVYSFNPSL